MTALEAGDGQTPWPKCNIVYVWVSRALPVESCRLSSSSHTGSSEESTVPYVLPVPGQRGTLGH